MSGSFPDRRNNLFSFAVVKSGMSWSNRFPTALASSDLPKMRKSHGEHPIGRRVVGVVLERATAPHHGFLELLQ